MPPESLSEAELRFIEHVNALSRDAKTRGPAPDCADRLAAIIAENEAECLEMERDAAEQDEESSRPSTQA